MAAGVERAIINLLRRIARGDLVEILTALATAGLPLHLAWPRSRQLSPKVNALLEALTVGLQID